MAHPLGAAALPTVPLSEKYAGSQHIGILPMGCIRCREGAKVVLFITGLCDKECFYCPVSREKMYRDVLFANERPIHPGQWDDLFDECDLIGAKGAGITGGDPMVVPERVVDVTRALKAHYGPDFHIHLYTSCAFDTKWLAALAEAGLDEIRFHPDADEYKHMNQSWHHAAIQEALRVGLTTMVEIPCIPGMEEDIQALAHYLEETGAHGLNMNELEFSEPNIQALKTRGFQIADDTSQRVEGSRTTATNVLDAWRQHRQTTGSTFAVHFCSSPYKDAIQLMQRLRRRAERTARPFEEQTEEGTLLYAALRPRSGSPGDLAERLRAEYDVPPEWVTVVDDRVETAPSVAEVLAEENQMAILGVEGWISEVYPTADRLEVERIPLQPPNMEAAA